MGTNACKSIIYNLACYSLVIDIKHIFKIHEQLYFVLQDKYLSEKTILSVAIAICGMSAIGHSCFATMVLSVTDTLITL